MATTISELDEAQLRSTYRELKQEKIRLHHELDTVDDHLRGLEEPIMAAISERIWREHPRWQRDRPTPQRRVRDMAYAALQELKWGTAQRQGVWSLGHDIVEGSVVREEAEERGIPMQPNAAEA